MLVEAVHFRARHEVGRVPVPRNEEDVSPLGVVRHREALVAEGERDDGLGIVALGELGGRDVGTGLNHLRRVHVHVRGALVRLLAVPVHHVEQRLEVALLAVLDGEGDVARSRGGQVVNRRVVHGRVVAGVAPVDRVGARGTKLAPGVGHVDGHFLIGVCIRRHDHVVLDLGRAALHQHGGGRELAGEDAARGRVQTVRVHLHEQAGVLRLYRSAVGVHPEGVGRSRAPAGRVSGRHRELVVPGFVEKFRLTRHSHVVRRVQRRILLDGHLDRDGQIVVVRPRLGQRHVHGHEGLAEVGVGLHGLPVLAVHGHGHARRKRFAHLDGARDEVGDEEVRIVEDVRRRGGEENIGSPADRSRRLDGERHVLVSGGDAELAHLVHHAAAKVVLGDFIHLPALHDFGDVVRRPQVEFHRLGCAARDLHHGRAGIGRGRALRDGTPDALALVEVGLVEVDGLDVRARLVQVKVAVFGLLRPQPGRHVVVPEVGVLRKFSLAKCEIRRHRIRRVRRGLNFPERFLPLVLQIVPLAVGARRGTRAGCVRELKRQGDVAGLDFVLEDEVRVVPAPQRPRLPVGGNAQRGDALRLANAAAHPQAEARLGFGYRRHLLHEFRIVDTRPAARVDELPRIRVGRIRLGAPPLEVRKAEADVDRLADRHRTVVPVVVWKRVKADGVVDVNRADFARGLCRLGHGAQQRCKERGANADLFLHVHVEPPSF